MALLGGWGWMERVMTCPSLTFQDKGLLGTLATAASAGKLPGSVMVQAAFAQDERLSRPPPAATPSTLDINGR